MSKVAAEYWPGFPSADPSKMKQSMDCLWVELNGHMNYPLKECLISLEERRDIDIDCPHQKFLSTVSSLLIHLNINTLKCVNMCQWSAICFGMGNTRSFLDNIIMSIWSWYRQYQYLNHTAHPRE